MGLFDGLKKNSLNKRAYKLFYESKYLEALEGYDKILELDPNFTVALFGRSVVLRELGKYHEALEANDIVLELDPKDSGF